MNPLQRLLQLPARKLAGLLVALAATISLLIGAWIWGQTPDYKVLYSNLADSDGGTIVQALGQMNIPYKFAEGGGAILVPANMVYDARLKLASQGLPRGGVAGFELMDQQKFGTTQFQEQVNYQRSLEGELAKSIQSLASVQAARVHLAIPKQRVFLRDQDKPSASVLVNLYPGRALSATQISGIAHLVSSSVPELNARNVSIVDQGGNLLSSQDTIEGLDPGKLTYVREVERGYIRRILDILEPIVGVGNVRAQISADIDFSQVEQTAETYRPNGDETSAAMRSRQMNESNSAAAALPGGVPGVASNGPQAASSASAAAPSNMRRDTTVNYELDKTVRMTRQQVGIIKRISAAIVVNSAVVQLNKTGSEKAADKGNEAQKVEQLTALAKEAMGFNAERGDSINLVRVAFTRAVAEELPDLPMWQRPENLALAKELGVNLGIGLLVLYLVFGVIRPAFRNLTQPSAVALPETTQEPLSPQLMAGMEPELLAAPIQQPPAQLDRAKQLAKEDPKVVANVIRNWVAKNE